LRKCSTARAADGTVAHEGDRLLDERLVGPIDGVLERAGNRAVVLGGDDDVAVELVQFRLPFGGDLVRRRRPDVGRRRVEQRQRIVDQIDQLDVEIARLLGALGNPLRRLVALPSRPHAADNHRNLQFAHV
jgi:hypothetical protein